MATPYSFTQPVRYYKANDPYFYEVDNIPIRQLEENILYVKGLVEGSLGDDGTAPTGTGEFLTSNSELSIYNVKELRPKVDGGRTVRVNAGRFVSRVNDAFDISKPLNNLVFNSVGPTGTTVIPDLGQTWSTAQRNAVWSAFIGTTAASNSYNVNGLECLYTFYSTPGNLGATWGTTTGAAGAFPYYAGVNARAAKRWPGSSVAGHLTPTNLGAIIAKNSTYIAENLPTIHLAFVQMWRGLFRTSVVDFPESSIEIPAWDDNDFHYLDDNGDEVILDATQRIDLLVAYSLPIDASSTTRPDFQTGFCTGSSPTATTITTPTLGLVRGAGLGIQKNDTTNPTSIDTLEGCDSPAGPAGSARIAANKSDTASTANKGITRSDGTVIHGSFPSPDDLLNIAPVVAIGVDNDAFQLIGQAALPIAYVVVTKGQSTITAADIIDIRPFLRTTEFTYNERAGIAAANPPLSFANPAVGAFQLQSAINATLVASQNNGPTTVDPGEPIINNNGRAIYTDYVMGGLAYGVEGTLLSMCDGPQETNDPFGAVTQTTDYTDPYNNTSVSFADFTSSKAFLESSNLYQREAFLQYCYTNRQADLKHWLSDPNSSFSQNAYTYLGLPQGSSGRNIPLFPEWDMPMDGTNYLNLMGQGSQGSTASIPKVTWWMWFEGTNTNRAMSYAPGGVVPASHTNPAGSYLNRTYGFGWGNDRGNGFLNICSKKIEISFPSWVNEYDVLVEYINCGPVTSTNSDDHSNGIQVGLGSGLSINKGPVVSYPSGARKAIFQINSTSQNLPVTDNGMVKLNRITDKETGPDRPQPQALNPAQWLTYSVALPQFRGTQFGTDAQNVQPNNTMRFTPKFGAAYYPTVKFTIIGYTGSPIQQNASYSDGNNFTMLQGVQAGNSAQLTSLIGPVNGTSKIDIQGLE